MNENFEICLFDFQTIDDEEAGFEIQVFANTENGDTCFIRLEGFSPFFYAKVNNNWTNSNVRSFESFLQQKMGELKGMLKSCSIVRRKKLRGFDNNSLHKFLFIQFTTEAAFHRAKSIWYKKDEYNNKILIPGGLQVGVDKLELYEANIPPLLRSIHICEISPSGWVSLPLKYARKITGVNINSRCKYNYAIDYRNIVSLPDKNTPVPRNICSFDIEAQSHGDFPVPVKTYQKLAIDILDAGITTKSDLKYAVQCAFIEHQTDERIHRVYPKRGQISTDEVNIRINKWLDAKSEKKSKKNNTQTIQRFLKKFSADAASASGKQDYSYGNEDSEEYDDVDEEENNTVNKNISNCIEDELKDIDFNVTGILTSKELSRDEKLDQLNASLMKFFPTLKGDYVSCIGSTFIRSGEDVPNRHVCIVLGTCDEGDDGIEIQCCETEKDLLLAWRDLILSEDPDAIIGYNIFSFDFDFLFHRACENNCCEEFLKLSRIKDQVCGTLDIKTNTYRIDQMSMKLSNGNNILNIIQMPGRIQIDMYYWFLRTENLPSFKLDFVGSYFIGDKIRRNEFIEEINRTRFYTKNMVGLEIRNFIKFDEINHSTDSYKGGAKFRVEEINRKEGWFEINGCENPSAKIVKWGLAKDDISPKDIFRLTDEGPASRYIVAKYCIQDCNIVHHLFRKIDVFTELSEMARLCCVPMSFLIFRGQGIKLTSYVSKKCRAMGTLMPVLDCKSNKEGYDGAVVLIPKIKMYLEDPVCTGDYAGLYPSSMISENLCSSSKVWVKYYNLNGKLVREEGERNPKTGEYIYDNLPNVEYVNVRSDTYIYKKSETRSLDDKVHTGYRIARFAQYPEGKHAVLPAILKELTAARKSTRKQIPLQTDEFMKNTLNKRQKAIKVVANSVYGQTGAKVSTFYDVDIAASTTAMGRCLLLYAKRIIEDCFGDFTPMRIRAAVKEGEVSETEELIYTRAEYIYGDTDSVFFNLNLYDENKVPIKGQRALDLAITAAQDVCNLATKFLKPPHDFEYEKTYYPLCLLSKKRYVGMLHEFNPNEGVRNEMGIVLKRLDNAPIVKTVYGGAIDILMKERSVEKAIAYVQSCLQDLIDGNVPLEKLTISKSLRAYYKNPRQIAHRVLADRVAARGGDRIHPGDRVPYVYIVNNKKDALQGERIDLPNYVTEHKIQIDYAFYITNQIMKPVLQLFGLVVEDYWKKIGAESRIKRYHEECEQLRRKHMGDDKKISDKISDLSMKKMKEVIFDPYLHKIERDRNGLQNISNFFIKKPKVIS